MVLKEEQQFAAYFTPGIIIQKHINMRTTKWRYIRALRSRSHKQNSWFDFRVLLMFTFDEFEATWVLVSSGTQVQPQVILKPDYLSDYLSVSYDFGYTKM